MKPAPTRSAPRSGARPVRVAWTPHDVASLAHDDLSNASCAVIDVLRATTVVVAALDHGARAIIPVESQETARALREATQPTPLLAGERNGLPPDGFDLGNSPRDFVPARVRDRTIVHTTTNGTKAFRACAACPDVVALCFRNLETVAQHVDSALASGRIAILVCAGTHADFALEDALCAGALCDRLGLDHPIRSLWLGRNQPLVQALSASRNGRRLAQLNLEEDIMFAAQIDASTALPRLGADGRLT